MSICCPGLGGGERVTALEHLGPHQTPLVVLHRVSMVCPSLKAQAHLDTHDALWISSDGEWASEEPSSDPLGVVLQVQEGNIKVVTWFRLES